MVTVDGRVWLWLAIAMGACGGQAEPSPKGPPLTTGVPASRTAAPAEAPAAAEPLRAAVKVSSIQSADDVLDRMAKLRDDMCRCTDKACADRVTADLTRFGNELTADTTPKFQVTDRDTQKLREITDKMTKCMMAAMTSGLPPEERAHVIEDARTSQ